MFISIIVLHHRDGGNHYVYRYLGADGQAGAGRFPKSAPCFVPNVPRDPIAGPVSDDFSFGDKLAPVNALPKDYVSGGLIDARRISGHRLCKTWPPGAGLEFLRRIEEHGFAAEAGIDRKLKQPTHL